ncbi:MAG: class I tRNA ligase family protein [bacterium]|nr:class I tRNA ligase family protein [bacterium]
MKKKFYITTSIAYTNASPHLGYALESIQADVLARHHRLLGEDVFFLTGTDEHGAKIAQAAKEVGKKPMEFVDEITEEYKLLKKILCLSNDDFLRTTDQKRHWPGVEKIWKLLKKKGDIVKKQYKGLYCIGCEAFLHERDLIEGKCPIHFRAPEMIEEENYFFLLTKYAKILKKLILENKIKIVPKTRRNEMLGLIKQGLEDVSFSRIDKTFHWGIPVPGDSSQVLYVWADALTNYISALGYGTKKLKLFTKFWPADVHCVGKDIARFHILLWPAMLLSAGLKLPKTVFVHGFITVAGQKMSKSLGNIIDPFELVKKYGSASSPQVGTDAVRYFLLREIPATGDGDFTYEKFEQRYNADLAKGLGNLVARIVTLASKSELPFVKTKTKTRTKSLSPFEDKNFNKLITQTQKDCKKALDNFKLNEALEAVWGLISFCDRYIEKEKPWEEGKEKIISDLLVVLKKIAELLIPFLPETSEKILRQIKDKKSEPLFPRI